MKNHLLIVPVTASDESPVDDATAEFRRILKEGNVPSNPHLYFRDAVGTGATYIGEAVELTTAVLPIVSGVLGAWLSARYGRKVRLKLNDQVEVEAQTPEDVAKLLQIAQPYIHASKDGPNDEK